MILLSKLTLPKYKLAVDNKSDSNTIYFTLLHIYFAGDCFWRFYLFVHAESIEKEAISRQKSRECRGYKFVWTRDDEHILIFEQCSTASSTGKTTPARETASMRKFCNQAAGNSDDLENSLSYRLIELSSLMSVFQPLHQCLGEELTLRDEVARTYGNSLVIEIKCDIKVELHQLQGTPVGQTAMGINRRMVYAASEMGACRQRKHVCDA